MLNKDKEEILEEEEKLRIEVSDLLDRDKKQFYREYEKKIKDPDTYAVLNYLFITGLHHFYLGNYKKGFINLAVFLMGIAIIFMGYIEVGIGVIVLMSIIELYALFFSQLIIRDYNNQVSRKILNKLRDIN